MKNRGRSARVAAATGLGLVLLLAPAAAIPGAASVQEPPTGEPAREDEEAVDETGDGGAAPSEVQPDHGDGTGESGAETEPGDGGGATEKTGKTGSGKRRPVAIGLGPKSEAQSCQATWETCNDRVQENLDSMWQIHRKRRQACDKARRDFELACDHPDETRPSRCKRRAQSDWRQCDSISDRDHIRELRQIQRQRRACAQVYRICIGI